MAGVKKRKFVPKEKRTLVSAPKWAYLSKAVSEHDRMNAFNVADSFVHYEVGNSEQNKALKLWIRKYSGWDVNANLIEIPDVHLSVNAKLGWIAIKLGYMPDAVKKNLDERLLPLILNSAALRENHDVASLISPEVAALGEDSALNVANVKEWIQHWSGWVAGNRKSMEESKDSAERMKFQIAQNYVFNLRTYLHTGIYNDHKFGLHKERSVIKRCFSMAYDSNGLPKRNVGTWYPDIGLWTKENAANAT